MNHRFTRHINHIIFLETSRRIKEALCYVSKVSPFDMPTSSDGTNNSRICSQHAKSYKLPDGTDIVLSNDELSSIPEMLFTSPVLGGRYSRVEPLSKLIYVNLSNIVKILILDVRYGAMLS